MLRVFVSTPPAIFNLVLGKIMNEARVRAVEEMTKHKNLLEDITKTLIEKETLDEIRKIAKSEGMKIYGVINKILEAYKKSLQC